MASPLFFDARMDAHQDTVYLYLRELSTSGGLGCSLKGQYHFV